MSRTSLFREYLQFMRREKKWWMIPIVFLFLIVGTLVVVLEGSALAPFIYAIF